LECSIALAFLAQNDFYGVSEFEYLCVRSSGSALERDCTVFERRDLSILPIERVNELLTIYLQAVAAILDEGRAASKSRMAGYHIVDPKDPDLFK
jgi:hypothetical protein